MELSGISKSLQDLLDAHKPVVINLPIEEKHDYLGIIKTVFGAAPKEVSPETLGEALVEASLHLNKENPSLHLENIVDYLIKTLESAQKTLDEIEG